MPCVGKVLIVGGGVAGLAAAIALGRRGIACDIAEISPTGDALGAAITFTGRAIEALDELGLLQRCLAVQGRADIDLAGGMFDTAGDPIPGANDRDQGHRVTPVLGRGLPQTIGMYRPVFAQIALSAAQANGASLRLGTSIAAIDQGANDVGVTFLDGSTARYDLVVGADGIRSKVRELVFGDEIKPEYAGQCSMRWTVEGPPIDGLASHYFGPFGKLMGYALPHQNLTYLVTVFEGDADRHVDPDDARAILSEQLGAFTAPYVVELAKRFTPQAQVIYRPFEWLLVPDPWYRGRVLLIGDAAHATTAHMSYGGGLGLEDAVVLADCLDTSPALGTALATFMTRRFERARTVVETSVLMCRMEKERTPFDIVAAKSAPGFAVLAEPY